MSVYDVTTETEARPTETPPGVEEGDGVAPARPRELGELTEELIGAAGAAVREPAPTIEPEVAVEGEAIGLWQTGKTVNALYTTAHPRNSWLHIVSPSIWRKFAPVSDSGVTAMTMLAAHARDRGRPTNFREEADSLVHEIYVW